MHASAAARVALPVFAAALAVDLATKAWAVHGGDVLIFNARANDLPLRLAACLAAVATAAALTWFTARAGLGRQWGLWIGCGLLVAGVIANGVSPYLWSSGVPDFIDVGDGWVWNVADFEIAVGLTGGLLSVGGSALAAYVGAKRWVRRG